MNINIYNEELAGQYKMLVQYHNNKCTLPEVEYTTKDKSIQEIIEEAKGFKYVQINHLKAPDLVINDIPIFLEADLDSGDRLNFIIHTRSEGPEQVLLGKGDNRLLLETLCNFYSEKPASIKVSPYL